MKLRDCYVVNTLDKDASGCRHNRPLMTLALNAAGRWLTSAEEACQLAKSILGEAVTFSLRHRRVLYLQDGSFLTAWHGGAQGWYLNQGRTAQHVERVVEARV